jgi:hypothetical protein
VCYTFNLSRIYHSQLVVPSNPVNVRKLGGEISLVLAARALCGLGELLAVRGRGGRRSVGGLLYLVSLGLGTLSDSHAGTLAGISDELTRRPSLCSADLAKSARSAADGLPTNDGCRLECGRSSRVDCCWATGGGGSGGGSGGDGSRCGNDCENGSLADRTDADADAGRTARTRRSCDAAGVPRASASPGCARVIHTHLTWPASPTRGVRVGTAA